MLFYYFFSSQVIPRKAKEHVKGMELQQKEEEKDRKHIGNFTRKNPKVYGVY